MDSHTQCIADLREARENIAALEEVLALRVLQRRTLASELFVAIRPTVSSDTKAETVVKQDPKYLEFETKTAGIQHQRDLELARAESLRLRLELGIASLRLIGEAA